MDPTTASYAYPAMTNPSRTSKRNNNVVTATKNFQKTASEVAKGKEFRKKKKQKKPSIKRMTNKRYIIAGLISEPYIYCTYVYTLREEEKQPQFSVRFFYLKTLYHEKDDPKERSPSCFVSD